MSKVEPLLIEEDGETYIIYVESKETPEISEPVAGDNDRESMGLGEDAIVKMQASRHMIRGYAIYALSAFKDFGAAQIEEVTLKFGIKLGGKAGIPYITEGSAESNLEIEVKCKFPDTQKNSASNSG